MTSKRHRAIIAALAAALCTGAAAAPAQASSGVLSNGVCYYAYGAYGSYAGINGSMKILLSCRPRVHRDYVATKYNVRFPAFPGAGPRTTQFERTDYGSSNFFFANPGTSVSIQGCREFWDGSRCGPWSELRVPWW